MSLKRRISSVLAATALAVTGMGMTAPQSEAATVSATRTAAVVINGATARYYWVNNGGGTTKHNASVTALAACRKASGKSAKNCRSMVLGINECVSLAVRQTGAAEFYYAGRYAATAAAAASAASKAAGKGSVVITSKCTGTGKLSQGSGSLVRYLAIVMDQDTGLYFWASNTTSSAAAYSLAGGLCAKAGVAHCVKAGAVSGMYLAVAFTYKDGKASTVGVGSGDTAAQAGAAASKDAGPGAKVSFNRYPTIGDLLLGSGKP